MRYAYPTYGIDLAPEAVQLCCDTAVRLLDEVGFLVTHEPFLSRVRGKAGLRFEGQRVHLDPALTREYLDRFLEGRKSAAAEPTPPAPNAEWRIRIAGYSMATLDLETDEVRDATCQDLRDYIKLANSFGIGGMYPVMPQDLPPLMRALACFKICWEASQNIEPYDYQQPEQARYLYEMHQVMGKRFDLMLTVPSALTVDPKDLAIFLDFYPDWQRNRDIVLRVLDYGMLGLTKPVTSPGCATMQLADSLALHILFNLLDAEIHVPIVMTPGQPTDLRHACWAFGSPRRHLYSYLDSRLQTRLAGVEPALYVRSAALLETSSPAVDEQAALEKMACGLLAALQGARSFGYAGVLCVDDVFSPVQFVIDVEMVAYIRETIGAFNPPPDVLDTEGLFEECREVGLGRDTFVSHPNTVRRFRKILPSPERIVREKLRSWLSHRKLLKDRAKEEAIERIRTFEPYRLPEEKQRELDHIYARAEAELGSQA